MFAAQHQVDNLTVLIDCNKQQLDGWTKDICDLGGLKQKFEQFGWYAQEVDGHDVEAIYDAIVNSQECKGRPSVIVLDTIKGKGCSYAEAAGLCHHLPCSDEQYEHEIALLDEQLQALGA